MKKLSITLIAVFFAACTTVDYQSPEFVAQARGHQTVAVLPFEMVFTGRVPARLTPYQIARVEERESLDFQWWFYNHLLDRSSADRKRPIYVHIQPVETTNRLLDDAGIGLRDSWTESTERLARILGVDAVVRTSVHKTRYLSDVASYSLDVGHHVLHEVIDDAADLVIPPGATTTHEVFVDSSVSNGDDGRLLWRVAVHRGTDWTRPANDVIAGLTKKLAKKFPYRG